MGASNRGCATFVTASGTTSTTRFTVGALSSGVATQGRIIEFDPACRQRVYCFRPDSPTKPYRIQRRAGQAVSRTRCRAGTRPTVPALRVRAYRRGWPRQAARAIPVVWTLVLQRWRLIQQRYPFRHTGQLHGAGRIWTLHRIDHRLGSGERKRGVIPSPPTKRSCSARCFTAPTK